MLVYFSEGDGTDCSLVGRHERTIAAGLDPIRGSFDALVAGPTPEEREAGAFSFFSDETAGMIRSAELDGDLLIVDFEDRLALISNAGTSCGSAAFASALTSTAFQFPEVERLRLTLEGSCDEMMSFLQGECVDFVRDGESILVPVIERASGSGCSPGDGALPDGRWFGYVDAASDDDLSFDLACWFIGIAAIEAAAEDGVESPPPNGYHIRNEREVVRDLDVAPGTQVNWLANTGDPATATDIEYSRWVSDRLDRPFQPGLWLTVEDGDVVAIEEQYQP
ncbi:MAG: GerMN domain-containing protein [Acidimicrobiales bacterium]|nr:GerMN domain-containing protein [Acidimicrobiales bacterium]